MQRTRVHLLTDILIMEILSNGIPCPDTFQRVFERINAKVFECCFQRWVQSIVETVGVQVIPIDGKTVRGSYDREQKKSVLHLVSAWTSEHRLVLGQVKVADKSNEIATIPV